eukprot:ANDGO_07368.mRNA.1 BLOC-1-related complex subunit 8 OS=Tetraodon nigroviridis GN=borcs8 PE=3 SV=1
MSVSLTENKKVLGFGDKVSDMLEHLAAGPSVGLVRIQDHIRRTVPVLVERKAAFRAEIRHASDASYAIEYAMGATAGVQSAANRMKRLSKALESHLVLFKPPPPPSPSQASPPAALAAASPIPPPSSSAYEGAETSYSS